MDVVASESRDGGGEKGAERTWGGRRDDEFRYLDGDGQK